MSDDRILRVITVGNDPSVKGGITSVMSHILLHHWNEQNVEMKFIPTYKGGSVVDKVIAFIKGYMQLKKEIKVGHVEIMHIHMSHNGSFTRKYYVHQLCKRYGVADIIHLHSSSFVGFFDKSSERKKKKIRELLTDCGCVVALGKEWERRVKKIAPEAKVKVLNNTIHIPAKCKNQDVDYINFLYLGVLVKRKGVIDLLKAIHQLKEDGVLKPGKVAFNIGGTGECEAELKEYVSQNDLRSFVNFLGWVVGEEKSNQLQNNQVLVLPSYNEGLPVAILEAISYGLPVVAANVGSVAEAVHDGENGFLYQAGDVDALTEALKKIIASPELRNKMADASRKLAETSFDDTKYFEDIYSIYRQVVR